ncbi:PAS domain S-box protein, partial [Alkalibaculum sp. M08DMB]|nr:PAS domain S-box protein [Alkalibaculum sporogenes]
MNNMNDVIGIIASGFEIKKMVEELFEVDVKNQKIIIDMLDENKIEQQGKILEKKGAKAIIARSGGYIHTIGTVDVPTINLEMTTIDILRAIKKAKSYNKHIVLVLSDVDYFDYEEWKDIISPSMTLERFNHKKQICDKVKKYLPKKDEVVIVGGGIPCRYAENFNIDSVFITASKESIREGVKYAKQLLGDLHTQKYNREILKNTLDVVHDSIIATDNTGNIILFNKKAQEIFRKDDTDILGKDLSKVFPELNFIFQVNTKNPKIKNRIVNIMEHTITANVSMINVENMNEGYLCTFQDITKLQELEKKIRVKLNKKGLVAKYKFEDIIAQSPKMILTIEKARMIAMYDNTTMIYGESGTGKEMFAQSIHNMSERKHFPFVAINCAALTESLLESELFGYE